MTMPAVMTPEISARITASKIVSAWSKNYMDEAARPTIQKQIFRAIFEAMVAENIACAAALKELEGFGPYSRQVAIETIRSRYDTQWEG